MMLQKNPEEVIHHAVSKMLPKNRNRPFLFKKYLIVHAGPVHNQINLKLPQFTVPEPHDINKTFDIDEFMDKDKAILEYASTPDNIPEELQGHERQLTDTVETIPHLAWGKEYTNPKHNWYLNKFLNRNTIRHRKYRMHIKY